MTANLRGELRSALLLQLREHAALVVLRRALLDEQPPRQALAVKLGEQVLVRDVRQQPDDLLQRALNRLV